MCEFSYAQQLHRSLSYTSQLLIKMFNARARSSELERRFTKFVEITQCNDHYAVQGHSRSPILVTIESSYTTSYTNLPPIMHRFQLMVRFSLARGECVTLTLSLGWSPANIAIKDILLKTRFFGLHFHCMKYWCIFNHFYVIRPESYRISWNYCAVRAITPFKVIQGHRFWYQLKAHIRLPISD